MGIGDSIYNTNIDAIEINCSRPIYANQLAREAAKIMELPLISGSDSHTSFQVTVCAINFTSFSAKIFLHCPQSKLPDKQFLRIAVIFLSSGSNR